MFISPRYKLLPPPAFTTYLQLSTSLINGIPLFVFKPPATKGRKSNKAPVVYKEPDSDSDLETKVSVVSEFVAIATPIPPLVVDEKTTKCLQNIIATPHLASLILTTQSKPSLFPHVTPYLFALTATWTSSHNEILNAVLASTGGGLVRELYRDHVRSPLGEEANSGNLFGTSSGLSRSLTPLIISSDSASASHWSPVLLLADLYSQALLTMGDDEFSGSSSSSTSSSRAQPSACSHLTSWYRLASGCSTSHLRCTGAMISRSCMSVCFVAGEVLMGDGKREGDKVLVGYPCERVSSDVQFVRS